MIKLTHLDGRALWIAKGAISTVELPLPGLWHPDVKALVNGSFGVKETVEHVLEMIK